MRKFSFWFYGGGLIITILIALFLQPKVNLFKKLEKQNGKAILISNLEVR